MMVGKMQSREVCWQWFQGYVRENLLLRRRHFMEVLACSGG